MDFFTVQAPNATSNSSTSRPIVPILPTSQPHQMSLNSIQNQAGMMMMRPPNAPNLPTIPLQQQQQGAELYSFAIPGTPMGMTLPSMQQALNFGNGLPMMQSPLGTMSNHDGGVNGVMMGGVQQLQQVKPIVPTSVPADAFQPHPTSVKSSAGGDQRPPGWARRPLVAIPEFNHSIIQTVLDINKQLIKILIDYQNFGWFQEQEFKMYQARLQSNIAYLVTAQDFLDSKVVPARVTAPDLSPVTVPARLKASQGKQPSTASPQPSSPATAQPTTKKSDSSNRNNVPFTSTNLSTKAILASIDPPAMIRDPNPANQLNASTYTPIQPFVLPQPADSKLPIPPHLNPLPVVSVAEASAELTRRMVKGPSILPSEQRSLRTVKDDEDLVTEVTEKKVASGNTNSMAVDEGGDDDPQDEDYAPGPDDDGSPDDTADETDRDISALMMGVSNGGNGNVGFGMGLDLDDIFGQGL